MLSWKTEPTLSNYFCLPKVGLLSGICLLKHLCLCYDFWGNPLKICLLKFWWYTQEMGTNHLLLVLHGSFTGCTTDQFGALPSPAGAHSKAAPWLPCPAPPSLGVASEWVLAGDGRVLNHGLAVQLVNGLC